MKLAIVLVVLFISSISFAEVYKWVDEKGTVHFTEDPSTIPEKYREKAKGRTTEEDLMTPQEKAKKQSEEYQRTRSRNSDADDAAKAAEERRRRERANYFCSEATRLKRNIQRAQAEYYAISIDPYARPSLLQSYYNDIIFARRELEDFEEQARKNAIPPGWLRCQFE